MVKAQASNTKAAQCKKPSAPHFYFIFRKANQLGLVRRAQLRVWAYHSRALA